MPSLDAGGAEKFLVDLIKNLDQNKFILEVILFSHAGFFIDELKDYGIPIKVIKKRYKIDILNFIRLFWKLSKSRADIIHTQLGGDVYGRLIGWMIGTKVIISTEQSMNKDESFLINLARTLTARFADRIVAISKAVKRDMIKRYRIDPRRTTIIYNGIDIAHFLRDSKTNNKFAPHYENNCLVFGGMGRLSTEKNWPTLLRAISLLKNQNVKCLIAGAGIEQDKLELLIKELNITAKVELVGLVRDVKGFLGRLSFFVLPSHWEGLGVVLLEAGISGLPVIASEIDGISEIIINNKTGLTFNPNSPADLAVKIDLLINHINSLEVMRTQENLQEHIRNNFDIKVIARQYERLYQDLYYAKIEKDLIL
jgi:glycosyltransferase involved in cell wall biosynthesis